MRGDRFGDRACLRTLETLWRSWCGIRFDRLRRGVSLRVSGSDLDLFLLLPRVASNLLARNVPRRNGFRHHLRDLDAQPT